MNKRPIPHFLVEELKGYGGVRRDYVDVPEGQMHYLYQGSGKETILLIHMALSSCTEFTRVIPLLSKKYRVLAPDLPGAGESDMPPREYEIEDYSKSILSFMDAMKIEKAHILGHHASAQMAVEIEVTHPERVSSLLLSAMPCSVDHGEYLVRRGWPEMQRVEVKWDGSHLMDFWDRANRFGESVQTCNERALDYFKAGPRGEEMHTASFNYYVLPKLKLIKCPTLLLCGSNDWLGFVPGYERAKEEIPGVKEVIVKGGTVVMYREIPEKCATAILDFVDSLNPRG